MPTPRKSLLVAAVLGGTALLTAGAVLAHGGWGGPWRHGGPGGMALLDDFDTNDDGKVTQAKIDEARRQRLVGFDRDGNGELSLEEYQALWLDAMRGPMTRQFQANDADASGGITVEEFQARYEDVVTYLDRDGNGELTRDELRRRGRGMRQDRDPGPDADED
jgi:Ca2+-binding EF-hand superfamily protein